MHRLTTTTVGIAALVVLLAFNSNALAFHVGCGETITADTSLDTDLACTGGAPAIEIGAHAVTFDLNGHTINHGGSAAPAIENSGFDGVTIENGQVITDSGDGLFLDDADRSTLRKLEVVRIGGGQLQPMPVVLVRSDDALIEGNGFYGWTGALRLRESHGGVIRGNRTGLYVCALRGECSAQATGGGVSLEESDDNVIAQNTLSQGISGASTGSDRNLFTRNTVTLSISTGLGVGGGEGNVAYRNTAFKNAFSGIGGSSGARIVKNEAFDNGGSGIAAFGAGTRVSHNLAYRNRDDGVHAFHAGVIIDHNRADDNGDLGIEAALGVVDGRGNKASGNGNPAQCVNIACK